MTELTDLSETDSDNTSIGGINIDEGCAPSGMNNAARNTLGLLRRAFKSTIFRLRDATDQTKLLAFDLSGLTTATTRTLTVPDASGTLDLINTAQTVSAVKTYSAIPVMSGGGIKFPATQVASADVNTLDDYEEGTWTPTLSATSGTITTVGATSGTYTKIGRQVTIIGETNITTNGTGATGLVVGGLPFNINGQCFGVGRESNITAKMINVARGGANSVELLYYDASYPGGSGTMQRFSATYFA